MCEPSCRPSPIFSIGERNPLRAFYKHSRRRLSRRSVCKRLPVTNVFTGIVQGTAVVAKLTKKENFSSLEVQFPEVVEEKVSVGSSVALNGACLTATSVGQDVLTFDAMGETLAVTNLGDLDIGSVVNYERAARFGDEIGGHTLSGHVHTVAEITSIETSENNCRMTFSVQEPWMKYILSKGYVAVDGVSLTACDATDEGFSVYLIPETLRSTTLNARKVGTKVNIEVESQTQAIVDTVERVLENYMRQGRISSP